MQIGEEVRGIRLERLLCECATETWFEAVCVPLFPCKCSGYYEFYSMRSDVCCILWYATL